MATDAGPTIATTVRPATATGPSTIPGEPPVAGPGVGEGAWSLGVAGPGLPAFFPLVDPEPADGGFRVDTVYSGLSAGTELSSVKGTNPTCERPSTPSCRVFDGEARHRPSRCASWATWRSARVADSRHPDRRRGDLVAMRYGHADGHTAEPDEFHIAAPPTTRSGARRLRRPHGPDLRQRAAARGRRGQAPEADPDLGDGVRGPDTCWSMGAGVVGLLTGLFARHLGAAEVAVADPTPERLAAAEALGLLPVDETATRGLAAGAKDRWVHGPGDRGADVVFQCRGQRRRLARALRSLRPAADRDRPRVLPGRRRGPAPGRGVPPQRPRLRCAQIGRVPRGLAAVVGPAAPGGRDGGPAARRTATPSGRTLVTDVVPVAEAPQSWLDLAARRRHALQPRVRLGTPADVGLARR